MFTLEWKYKQFEGNKITFENREEAKECWAALRTMPGILSLNGYEDKPQPKRYNVCRVQFVPGGKPYTYLSRDKVSVGSTVVVWTTDGRELVKVIDSGVMTESELAKICPLNRFKYIEGKVEPA